MTSVAPPAAASRQVPLPVSTAIVLAWATSIAVHATGHADALDHDALLGHAASPSPEALAVYAGAWIAMVTAMMLPSATPLIRLFTVASAARPRAGLLLFVFVAGYLAVWTLFGWIALGFDDTVHHAVDAWPWLDAHPGIVLSLVLALTGAFQLSRLKDRCLDICRHPGAYLLTHYRRGASGAFRLGWNHGLFCLGCCWALMFVAFAAGMTDLRLMAGFTALMAYEKIGRHGIVVASAAGAVLLALAAAVATASLVSIGV
jgi:predicted metal-binding membrane protein